jgi:hypothetical protein
MPQMYIPEFQLPQIPQYIHYTAIFILYSFSMAFSFLFAGLFIRPLSLKELEEDAEEERLALKRFDEQNFEYKYLDEYEQLEEKEIDFELLKEKDIHFEIPFLKTTIIMFYDDGFKYYSNTDVIYKYLNVVCRKFVIDNDVKKLYIDGKLEEVTTDSVKSELFVTKAETTMLERKCNQFIRVGSIYDYNDKKNIKLIKEIDILDFLKSCNPKTDTETDTETDCDFTI